MRCHLNWTEWRIMLYNCRRDWIINDLLIPYFYYNFANIYVFLKTGVWMVSGTTFSILIEHPTITHNAVLFCIHIHYYNDLKHPKMKITLNLKHLKTTIPQLQKCSIKIHVTPIHLHRSAISIKSNQLNRSYIMVLAISWKLIRSLWIIRCPIIYLLILLLIGVLLLGNRCSVLKLYLFWCYF